MKISDAILRIFFPPKCIACGKLVSYFSKFPYCEDCYAQMKLSSFMSCSSYIPKHVDSLYIMYNYSNDCVKHSVFHAKKTFSSLFANFYKASCEEIFEKHDFIKKTDLITYATRRSSEIRREGIDQSEQMAKTISMITTKPYKKTLKRTHSSKKQRSLSQVERAENVKGVFAACADVKGKRILLLDDVMTTGSTLSECAKVLKSAGAKSVIALVFSC